ncbi:putative membrane protein [Bacillus fengqiuensis]|nr:putative membrane protein [Bacillus fengqiuensis]
MKRGKSTTIHLFLLMVVIAVFIWSVIKPAGYLTWALEVSPAIVGLIIVFATYNKFRLTTLSYVIITILAISMFVGGHYIYSKVPLFDWIKDVYDLKRNHYDRFGHLLKGLFAIVLREILLRETVLTKGSWLFTIVISMSLAISALYEIIEWLVSKITKGGKASKDFLGTQGDIWDTQWDMLWTLVGSIVALLILSRLHDRLLKKEGLKE